MKLVQRTDDLPLVSGGAVTIGNFDGVHRGHAKILAQVRARADECQGPAVVFTFDPHPVRLLRPDEAPPPLTWTRRKADLLRAQSIDAMVAYPTDRALLQLSPEAFFQNIVVDQLQARALVEGPNFYFGQHRAGDIQLLHKLCSDQGIPLDIVEPVADDRQVLSSSRVRTALADGDVDTAREMLTSPYRIRGMVTHGARRGGSIGFPTANLDAVDTLTPGYGVYSGRAYWKNRIYGAAIHIGPNPTFQESHAKIEVHLIGFDATLYGEPLEVDFLSRLRDIQPFPSVEALRQQLASDVERARRHFEDGGPIIG